MFILLIIFQIFLLLFWIQVKLQTHCISTIFNPVVQASTSLQNPDDRAQ